MGRSAIHPRCTRYLLLCIACRSASLESGGGLTHRGPPSAKWTLRSPNLDQPHRQDASDFAGRNVLLILSRPDTSIGSRPCGRLPLRLRLPLRWQHRAPHSSSALRRRSPGSPSRSPRAKSSPRRFSRSPRGFSAFREVGITMLLLTRATPPLPGDRSSVPSSSVHPGTRTCTPSRIDCYCILREPRHKACEAVNSA